MLFPPSARLGALTGLAGLALWVIFYAIAVAAMVSTPQGYDITRNYLSDLGNATRFNPQGYWAFNTADVLAGLFAIPFGLALGGTVGGRPGTALQVLITLAGLALVGVGLVPEDSPVGLHGTLSLVFFLLLTISLGVLTPLALRAPTLRPVGGWVTAAAFVLNVILITTFVSGLWNDRLAEHLGVYAALAWQLSTSLHLLRATVQAASGAPTTG